MVRIRQGVFGVSQNLQLIETNRSGKCVATDPNMSILPSNTQKFHDNFKNRSCGCNSVVECWFSKPIAEGSNPFSRFMRSSVCDAD